MLTITRKNALCLSIALGLLISGHGAAQTKQNELTSAGVPILWHDLDAVTAEK